MQAVRRRMLKRIWLLAALAPLVAGCGSVKFDAPTEAGLNQVKTDSGALYANLQKPPPDCLYASNTDGFGKVTTDVSALQSQVASVSNNSRTQKGVADLAQSFEQFRMADQGPNCLPSSVVSAQQSATDAAIGALVAYEERKPR